ncbi:MAG: hypothetical protein Q7R57_09470 [Dehalococcoidales bacterium]|nr:hypothetical protein [Dehalococcoidales bacterium]
MSITQRNYLWSSLSQRLVKSAHEAKTVRKPALKPVRQAEKP